MDVGRLNGNAGVLPGCLGGVPAMTGRAKKQTQAWETQTCVK
jgi:hypothetical protein